MPRFPRIVQFLRARQRYLVSKIDFRLLVSLLILLVLFWLFGEIAESVESGSIDRMDRGVITWFQQNLPQREEGHFSRFYNAVRDITALGSAAILIFLCVSVSAYFALTGRWRTGLFLLVTTSLGWYVMDELKEHYQRQRPETAKWEETSMSFPSGHAKMSAVVYLTLGALLAQRSPRKRVKVFWLSLAIFLTLLIGCSRVYLGVHYPSDVLAGWLAGAAWAILAFLLARVWSYRHLVWAVKHREEAHTDGPRG
jgi:undecaprenyl-diphosphatase